MYYLYIAQSKKNGRYYIGSTNEPDRRIIEHNAGKTKSLRYLRPLKIVFSKWYSTSVEARAMEFKLKKSKSRVIIEQIVRDQEIRTKGAHGIAVTRVHGMDESGVRLPAGPPS